jgi:hypothetical protein
LNTYHVSLLPPPEAVRLHNETELVGHDAQFVCDQRQWSYSASFPIVIPPAPDPDLQALIEVDVEVLDGRVGVGIVDPGLRNFITTEVDADARRPVARIELQLGRFEGKAHVMVRNVAPSGLSSSFRLLAATLDFTPFDRRLLVPARVPPIRLQVHEDPQLTGTFDVLLSHSSRNWNAHECDRDYLRGRYDKPDRLSNPPSFESLPPNVAPYHGFLSLLRLRVSPTGLTSEVVEHYRSPEKIVHAAIVGDRIVVCFDAGLAHFAYRSGGGGIEAISDNEQRIIDPWFGGLHTVIAVSDRTCLVSSAGADAILWLDVQQGKVIRRWRLPAERYGTNYALDERTWLGEHYIPNDLQLGHLNCAAPDGRGGACFSVLGQGDVGHVDRFGSCDVLVSGYVGCHGARYRGDELFFCDSCRGRLMRVDGSNSASVLFDADSRWLHDAVHLAGGLFLMTLGDRNQLVLADVDRAVRVAEWDFSAGEGTVQFLGVVARPPGC